MKKILIVVTVAILSMLGNNKAYAQPQDTVSVMFYNLLDYPLYAQERCDTLKKIVQYVLPDIFVVSELTSSTGVSLILNNSLNQNGISYYKNAVFYGGTDTYNMLFYNSNKIALKSQHQIATDLRDISEYVVYYKAPDLATTQDTVFFYLYGCHLKAGSTTSNANQRYSEAVSLKNYMSTRAGIHNVMVGGDFNFYGDNETGFTHILNGGSPLMYDPIAQEGIWHVNSAFKNYHTQSTRDQENINGGATGGLDDRFDFIFVSNDLQTGAMKAKCLPSTYHAVGNDGNHYNSSLMTPASNTQVPLDVALALRNMSDHLPVEMKVVVGGNVGITENNFVNNFIFNSETHQLKVYLKDVEEELSLSVYDITGKMIESKAIQQTKQFETTINGLKSGIYIINLSNGKANASMKVVAY